jgi:hypothetical protein
MVSWDKHFLDTVCRLDGLPVDVFRFIVLQKLGIAITGLHDDDQSQLAITVFKKGAFDDLISSDVPYSVAAG